MTDDRPDPDALLERAAAEAARARRGQLRIYFGASAGVGKTYAMLEGARALHAAGTDLLVGLVETHGRRETEALLEGLPLLPRRTVALAGRPEAKATEFDLDAALARAPAVLLVDELAHSNAPGSRHPKRWQDVQELLGAGISVHTTLNVQHLESLNDVVGGFAQVRVHETVPDHVFDAADEVVLVDLPPDELLQRLAEGKVYRAEQAEHAARNFFRKGNLMALRELALRRTADRVDDQVRHFRRESGEAARPVWHVADALLVAVGPEPGAERVVRAAARRAAASGAPWHAVSIVRPGSGGAAAHAEPRALALAASLGAVTTVLDAGDVPGALVAYAREHNLGTLVIGRREGRPRWRGLLFWGLGVAAQVARRAPDIDLAVVAAHPGDGRVAEGTAPGPRAAPLPAFAAARAQRQRQGYAWAAAGTALITALCLPLREAFELANIALLYLLPVVGVAWRFGGAPAVLAAALAVLALNFFFIEPRFTFEVANPQYLLTFAVMLGVGSIVGALTARSRSEAEAAIARERRTKNLYELARELGGALQGSQIAERAEAHLEAAFAGARVRVLLAEDGERLAPVAGRDGGIDAGLATWCLQRARPAGLATDTLPASPVLYLPLVAPMRTRGVLAVRPASPLDLAAPEVRRLLDTAAALVAIAVERVHFVAVAQGTLVAIESERLRHTLLAALSHDLRTPLTALVGGGEALAARLARGGQAEEAAAAEALVEQARRTTRMVINLLEMARLRSGAVPLARDWLSLEELLGSARRDLAEVLLGRRVVAHWAQDLPLLRGDAVLLERVLVNLLDNAARHTPAGTAIDVSARVEAGPPAAGAEARSWFVIEVADHGPGLPPGRIDVLFDAFERGAREMAVPGVGLGLAICRAIVEAHGGRIEARQRRSADGRVSGAVFTLRLPHEAAPATLAEETA
jgi:two-component system sensor histidine kinase KdpD